MLYHFRLSPCLAPLLRYVKMYYLTTLNACLKKGASLIYFVFRTLLFYLKVEKVTSDRILKMNGYRKLCIKNECEISNYICCCLSLTYPIS